MRVSLLKTLMEQATSVGMLLLQAARSPSAPGWLVRNPRILVLDEAASALDAETEAAIGRTLERVAHERTVISVTHRLASIARADRIVVLDHGRLVEQDIHPRLLQMGGAYAELWQKPSVDSPSTARPTTRSV